MKKILSSVDINSHVDVNLTDNDIRDAERIENDPQKILALIDLIFMFEDKKKVIPS